MRKAIIAAVAAVAAIAPGPLLLAASWEAHAVPCCTSGDERSNDECDVYTAACSPPFCDAGNPPQVTNQVPATRPVQTPQAPPTLGVPPSGQSGQATPQPAVVSTTEGPGRVAAGDRGGQSGPADAG